MVCDIYIPENNQKEQRINELKTLYTLDELINHCYEEEQEVERLNNIINKIEEYLEYMQKLYGINTQMFSLGVA